MRRVCCGEQAVPVVQVDWWPAATRAWFGLTDEPLGWLCPACRADVPGTPDTIGECLAAMDAVAQRFTFDGWNAQVSVADAAEYRALVGRVDALKAARDARPPRLPSTGICECGRTGDHQRCGPPPAPPLFIPGVAVRR